MMAARVMMAALGYVLFQVLTLADAGIRPRRSFVLTYFVFCPDLGAEMYLLTSFVRRSFRVSRTYLLAGGVFFAPNPRIKTDFTRIRRTW